MDFLKSAVASAISKGPAFPYSFGDRVDIDNSIWTLHNGTKREDGSKCSIFSFDITANRSRLPLARNALRKLRTLRHPGVIKVLDTVETDTYIYIATERLTPLGWHTRRKSLAEETLKWGLHNVAKTLKFINGDAASVHGCVRVSSVFTSESGEWKLGGFELLSSMKEDDAVIYTQGSLVPDSGKYMPPEIARSGWEAIKRNPVYVVDAYQFGILIFEAFNGGSMASDEAGQTKNIPPSMHQSYKRLFSQNPKARISVGQFLEQGQRHGGFFQTPLIKLTEDIDNLGLKGDSEKEEILSQLDEVSEDFPEDFFKMKVLPELLKSVEFGGGGPKAFGVVMKISKKLSDDEYDALITPVILRLFTSQDRALRVCLLDNLPHMIDHLSQKIVTDKIFPQMVTGFTDLAPVVREQTVKAVLVVVPKLSDRIINGELLRYLAKTANDEQPGIRTNTTICLGKIARNLGTNTRTKVLSAAFARSLRDPFVHARNAALMALAATADLFSEEDCATKILPALCPALVDKEKIVRDSASKSFEIFLQRIRKYASTLPDTVLPPPSAPGAAASSMPRVGTPQTDSSSWAGWAISSFTNKLTSASGDMQSSLNGSSNEPQRPSSVPPKSPSAPLNPTSSLNRSALSKSTTPNPFTTSNTPSEVEPEDFGSAWGDDDPIASPNAPKSKSKPSATAADSGWGDDDAGWDVDDADATADAFNDPYGGSRTNTSKPSVAYDDHGEPDFAGWLAAQSQAKQKTKSPLPKGLAKSSAARPSTGLKSNSTGNVNARKAAPAAAPKPKPVAVKKEAPKKEQKVEEEEDGWGDAWE